MIFKLTNGAVQFSNSLTFAGHSFYNRRGPTVPARSQGLQRSDLALDAFRPIVIALVNDEDVGNFHDACLYRLHIISHAGNKDYHCDVSQTDDIYFSLPHPDGLNHDYIAPRSIKNRRYIRSRAGQAA